MSNNEETKVVVDLAEVRSESKKDKEKEDKPTAEMLWRGYIASSGRIAGEPGIDGGMIPYQWNRTYWKPLGNAKRLKPVINEYLSVKGGTYYSSSNVNACISLTEANIENVGKRIKKDSRRCYIATNNAVLEVEGSGKIRVFNFNHAGVEAQMKNIIVRSHVDMFIDFSRVDDHGYYQLKSLDELEDQSTRFGSLIQSCFPDQEVRSVAREFLGDTYSPISRKAMVILIGEGDGGKSQLLKVLGGVHSNFAAGNLGKTDGFDLENFLGKQLIIIEEMPKSLNENTFKGLIGGSYIPVYRKWMDPLTIDPDFKIVVAANEMPRIDEKSGAVELRFYPIPVKQFKGKKIDDLGKSIINGYETRDETGRVTGHMPPQIEQVFEWLLHGLSEVYKRGRTLKQEELPEASQKIRRDIAMNANPCVTWIEDVGCEPTGDYGALMPRTVAFDHFKLWAEGENRSGLAKMNFNSWSRNMFMKAMTQKFGEGWSGRERKANFDDGSGIRKVRCYPIRFTNAPKISMVKHDEAIRSFNDRDAYDHDNLPPHIIEMIEKERIELEKVSCLNAEQREFMLDQKMRAAGYVETTCETFGKTWKKEGGK